MALSERLPAWPLFTIYLLNIMFFKRKSKKTPIKKASGNGNVPRHIAIIMDGNGRWAGTKGLPRTSGHGAGSEAFRHAAEYLNEMGVKYLTVYAFSTENWNRPNQEVQAIMALLEKYLLEAIGDMVEKNIRLRFFGELAPLSDRLKTLITKTEKLSEQTTGLQVNVCLNYGGRAEIVRAAKAVAQKCIDGVMTVDDITEQAIERVLYSASIPDPDLLIRPGGELRISNFLLWQNAYTEFYFTDTLWPDFDESEIDKAIEHYKRRNRRFGGIK